MMMNQRSSSFYRPLLLWMNVSYLSERSRAFGIKAFTRLAKSVHTQSHCWRRQLDRDFVESNGDYRGEAWLEDPEKALYSKQANLHRLPVLSLEETIDTFLPTALPLAKSPEEAETLEAACRSFPEQAASLQERLLCKRDENPNSSWLQKWWNQLGYLQVRDSNAYHVSYFFGLTDDPRITSLSEPAIARGAAVLQAAVEYARTIESGQKPVDILGRRNSITLCSTQYKYIFSACRIPRHTQDSYRIYRPTEMPHAAVACRGQFYSIPLTDDQGSILSRSELQAALRDCARQSKTPSRMVPELGWLTTNNREDWAEAYKLFSQTRGLEKALEILQSSLCMICLDLDDDWTEEKKSDSFQEPSDTQIAIQLLYGNMDYTANRWFDKSMQLILTKQGHFGYGGEHSMADGMPAAGLCQYMLERGKLADADDLTMPSRGPKATPIFESAFQSLSEETRREFAKRVEDARKYFTKTHQDHEFEVQHYREYGSEAIKNAGFSPDAFVQMAMQLAGYRCFGEFVGTYESAQTRQFLHGRTETTRTVSPASVAFCQSMQSDTDDVDKKRSLLQQATESHVSYTRKAVNGLGVDRHFFGLNMVLQDDEAPPDLFQHPLYQRSKRWRLSTSTVPGCAPGFGNVESDGLGIGYDTLKHDIIFHIAGRKEHNYVIKMSRLIEKSLDEMDSLFLKPQASL